MIIYEVRDSSHSGARVFKVSDWLLLFGVNANRGHPMPFVKSTNSIDEFKMSIAVFLLLPSHWLAPVRYLLGIAFQGKVQLLENSSNRTSTDANTN